MSGVISEDELRERLAAFMHDAWAHWTHHFLGVLRPILPANWSFCPFCGVEAQHGQCPHQKSCPASVNGYEDIAEEVMRWLDQIETPYAALTEMEKNSDRVWACKVLDLLRSEGSDNASTD